MVAVHMDGAGIEKTGETPPPFGLTFSRKSIILLVCYCVMAINLLGNWSGYIILDQH